MSPSRSKGLGRCGFEPRLYLWREAGDGMGEERRVRVCYPRGGCYLGVGCCGYLSNRLDVVKVKW